MKLTSQHLYHVHAPMDMGSVESSSSSVSSVHVDLDPIMLRLELQNVECVFLLFEKDCLRPGQQESQFIASGSLLKVNRLPRD